MSIEYELKVVNESKVLLDPETNQPILDPETVSPILDPETVS